jgi:hypothetical protein
MNLIESQREVRNPQPLSTCEDWVLSCSSSGDERSAFSAATSSRQNLRLNVLRYESVVKGKDFVQQFLFQGKEKGEN